MKSLCRICGSEEYSTNLINIFGKEGNELKLQSLILDYLKLQVQKDDKLPQHLCKLCNDQINIWHEFLEKSHVTNNKFRELLNSSQVEQEIRKESISLPPWERLHGLENPIALDFTLEKAETEKHGMPDHPTPLLCHVCGKHFKDLPNLKSHKRSHLPESLKKKHRCLQCSKTFRSKFHLSEHVNVHSGLTPYGCKQCGKHFHKRVQLRQHSAVHTADADKMACDVCGLRFNRKANLRAHARTHACDRTFVCGLCQQPCPTLGELLSHRKQHVQDDIKNRLELGLPVTKKVYTCDTCGKVMTNRLSLVTHARQHGGGGTSAGKYQCGECGKALSSRGSLAYHVRSQHTGERAFSCRFCNLGFMTDKLREAHEAKHTGAKPYKCETCFKGFRSASNLSQHMLKHEGERKFTCDVCGKAFYRKGALEVHSRTHTGDKPFICDVCGQSFRAKYDMIKHQKCHTERTCDVCSLVCASRKELDKHRSLKHRPPEVVPIVITDNMFQTQIITEDGQKIILAEVDVLNNGDFIDPSASLL